MKLVKILSEIQNTYTVICEVITDRNLNITDIVNNIRSVEKVTTVNNITPMDYPQPTNSEYTRLKIKFITWSDPIKDLELMKKSMTSTVKDKEGNIMTKIPGMKSVKFLTKTLTRK